jgi:hypothetical protein
MDINLEDIDKNVLLSISNSRYSNQLIIMMLSTIIVNINLLNEHISIINVKLDLLENNK